MPARTIARPQPAAAGTRKRPASRGGPRPASGAEAAAEPLVAYAAHELRGLITLQRTLAEVALADPRADVASLRAMGERVAAACERQERLLEALLSLARSEAGCEHRRPVDLASLVAAALRDHDCEGRDVGAALAPARISGDPVLLERLVANLLENAVRHNEPSGRVEIGTRTAAGKRAVLTVANSGPAVPSGELERIFEPFRRLTALGASGGEHGLGLGLAIVAAIARAHGAAIEARARRRGGLRIEVSFPALD